MELSPPASKAASIQASVSRRYVGSGLRLLLNALAGFIYATAKLVWSIRRPP